MVFPKELRTHAHENRLTGGCLQQLFFNWLSVIDLSFNSAQFPPPMARFLPAYPHPSLSLGKLSPSRLLSPLLAFSFALQVEFSTFNHKHQHSDATEMAFSRQTDTLQHIHKSNYSEQVRTGRGWNDSTVQRVGHFPSHG